MRHSNLQAWARRAAVLSGFAAAGCVNFTGDCGNNVQREVRSPDGAYIATVYERSCGATTGFSTQVHLRPSHAPFEAEPTAAGAEKDGIVFIVSGQGPVAAAWSDSTHVMIESGANPRERISRQEARWHDITITYSRGDRSASD